ncbi:MAG: hypothetical protein AAF405_06190 [Pseudomonadota bacterium]
MVWIMRGLAGVAFALGLVIVFVVLIGNFGTRDKGIETTAVTIGNRTVTITGHYETLSQESVADGIKIIVEGHEIMVIADQLSVDGKAQVLEPGEDVTVYVEKDGTTQVRIAPVKDGASGKDALNQPLEDPLKGPLAGAPMGAP